MGYNESSEHVTVEENHDSWVVIKGLKNGNGMNGQMVMVEAIVTAEDGTVTKYQWHFSVTGGNSGGLDGPGFGGGPSIPGFGGDDDDDPLNWG